MKHWHYLKYVLRHKWFVFQEGRQLGVPLWQLIIHDWSKFLPDEWSPYAEWFYGWRGGSWYSAPRDMEWRDDPYGLLPRYNPRARRRAAFDAAWLKHQHRSPHHWQYWVLQEDSGAVKVLPMPDRYRREMLADWHGAGRAIHGKDETSSWYVTTKKGCKLHADTEAWVEEQLGLRQGGGQ